ncbi:MAG: MFS transporter [Acidimicrobiia bacterium]|nr:MFS transporter [Acidimicrobiia bacterium]
MCAAMGEASSTDVAPFAAVQRRTLHVLMAGQVLGSAALGSAFAVGSFIVTDILGSGRLGGIASAGFTLGAALSSIPLSRLMARRGRRVGLQLGYALATLGGVVAVVGAQRAEIVVFLIGQLLFGVGNASNLLARYAATDLAEPNHRSRAISTVLVCSTFGAILGPTLVAPAEHVAEWLGLYRYTGPYLFSTVFYIGAVVNIAVRLRPDPLAVAGRLLPPGAQAPPAPPIRHALRVISQRPLARLALTSNVISQVTMVSVMTMTPLHMRDHGHESISQYVIALHVGGMYAFSPLVGRFADRHGRLPAIFIAGATLLLACVLAALAADVPIAVFAALWALGLGWSFGLISGSALLTESVPPAERVAVQGSADLIMSFCGAIAGFSSGFVREAWGFHTLANAGTLLAGALLVAAFAASRTARRASEALAPSLGG